jgi:hypothetical protein
MQNGFVTEPVFHLINNVGTILVHKADTVHEPKNEHVLSVTPWHDAVLRCQDCQDNLPFITSWLVVTLHDAQIP